MNFKQWVDKERPESVSLTSFCDQVGGLLGKTGRHVRRYYDRERKPKDKTRMAIKKLTKGKVDMDSWYDN